MESLRDWLASTGTTQAALAKQLGVSQPTVSDWARGNIFPDIENLRRLSTTTGLSFDALIGAPAHKRRSASAARAS
jgi:transcriptional regulator with XRE-family HTH domain